MPKVFFNLNFDDVHPEKSSNIADCGGDLEDGVFGYILELIGQFPKIKVTFFVTPNWIDKPEDPFPIKHIKKSLRVNYKNTWKDEPFRLDRHKEWCKWLNRHSKNIEVAVHGYVHHNPNHGIWHSQEFKGASYEESLQKIKNAEALFKKADLKFVKGFRPPGWGFSDGTLKALKEMKYTFIAVSPSRSRGCKVSHLSGLKNIPQNWSIREDVSKGLEMAAKCGGVYAKGHICDKYGKDYIGNGLNKERYEKIASLLEKLENDYEVKFVTMLEMSKLLE